MFIVVINFYLRRKYLVLGHKVDLLWSIILNFLLFYWILVLTKSKRLLSNDFLILFRFLAFVLAYFRFLVIRKAMFYGCLRRCLLSCRFNYHFLVVFFSFSCILDVVGWPGISWTYGSITDIRSVRRKAYMGYKENAFQYVHNYHGQTDWESKSIIQFRLSDLVIYGWSPEDNDEKLVMHFH